MFSLFEKKIKAYNKDKDSSNVDYLNCARHLSVSANIEFLLESKVNSLVILSSLDFENAKLGTESPSVRFKAMIESMSDGEYKSWVESELFH